jgi:hypothetical protein
LAPPRRGILTFKDYREQRHDARRVDDQAIRKIEIPADWVAKTSRNLGTMIGIAGNPFPKGKR